MSSGVGFFSERGRCYPFWVSVIKCKESTSQPLIDCRNQIEDYSECLHHTKEKARMIRIIQELEKQKAADKQQKE